MDNPTIQILSSHRSIRQFTAQTIEEPLFQSLIHAGQSAATSSHIQAYSIIRIQDTSIRNRLTVLAGNQPYINEAAEFLVFCADLQRMSHCFRAHKVTTETGSTEQLIVATVDTALVAQNIAIAAESEGIGICFIGAIRNEPETVSTLLNIPSLVYPVFGMCLGYPATPSAPKPRLPTNTVLMSDSYQPVSANAINAYDEIMQQHYSERKGAHTERTWSQNIAQKMGTKARLHMKQFLVSKGFNL